MENYTGKVLSNRYELGEIIGIGGMAVVYKAIDNIDNKTVAVKILKDEYIADDSFRKRFKNESKAVAMLSHQNIVKVYDVSFGESIQYIVMEHIEGITLKQYIKNKGRLDWRESVIFTAQILKALHHAHEKGVIHRDIKPQNIMLLPDNKTIKVADFGIARFDNSSHTKTLQDGAIGSVHYISPEQARGEIVDNKTDIYSVGVVLYEMLTGQLPFQSDNAVSVALMQLQQDAVMPRKINPSIPVGIEQITMRAMQKNIANRYQSAAEMLLDLDEFRRNPNIRFSYNYFVDTQPTMYASQNRSKTVYSSGTPVEKPYTPPEEIDADDGEYTEKTVITQEIDEYDYETEEIAKKNYTLPILFGIIFVFIIAVIGIACYLFTSSEEVVVPAFEGNYIDEIKDKSEYKYFFEQGLIEENLVYTTEYEDGYIFYQSAKVGTKMQITSTGSSIIKINIAYTSESMTVPTLDEGTKLQEAKSILQKMGFKVKAEGEVNDSLPESTVIRIDPASGQSVAYGSTVTIYYAVDDSDKVAVPSVLGEKLAAAQSELNELGFKVSVKYKDSDASEAGLVIEQSIAPDSTVMASKTEITIVVGVARVKTVDVSITLPDLAAYGEIYESVYVYVAGSLYKTYSNVKLDGSTHTVQVGGSSKSAFEIHIGTQKVTAGEVDFSSDVPAVTNKTDTPYKYEGETTKPPETTAPTETTAPPETTTPPVYSLPSYAGKTYIDYYKDLIAIGFDDITKLPQASDSVPQDYVISVSADKAAFSADELSSARIIVYVSSGPAEP